MKSSLKSMLVLLPLMLTMGCYKARVQDFSSGNGPGIRTTETVHVLVYGIVSLNEIDVMEICGDRGLYAVEYSKGLLGYAATWVTTGLYFPVSVKVECNASD